MIELSIPESGEDSRNTKDLIFAVFLHEQDLTLTSITRRIQKNYNVQITYQAVRKAVTYMHAHGMLNKTGKKYSLNKKWIIRLKNLFDRMLATYNTGKPVKSFTVDITKEDYSVYTFGNLMDLDNFWGDVMDNWVENLKPNDCREYVAYAHYGFWFLINLGRETKLFNQFTKKNIHSHVLFYQDFPLNYWAAKLYREHGVKARVKKDANVDETMGMNILGDYIIQVKYPQKLIKKMRGFFQKYRTTQEMSLREITEIAHEPAEIKFSISKNPTMAQNLRETYKKII